jgi:hypothetical protein
MTHTAMASRATGPLLVRKFLADYARNPVNLLVLVLVPAAFVAGAAGSMAQLAKLISGSTAPGAAVQTVTAGWAAAFIAATAAYFQVRAARAADRRLVLAGLPAHRLATARAVTGLALALVASAAAVITLAARTGIGQPGRVLAGRAFPTHFLTMWMTGLPWQHAGRVGDLGWALAWTAAAAVLAWVVLTSVSRPARAPRRRPAGGSGDQFGAAIRAGLTDWGRNRVLWVLLAAVPAAFIVLATILAPGSRVRLTLTENGRTVTTWVNLAFGAGVHPAFMAPIAIASLAILAGMFIILDSRAADQRLVLAGERPGALLAGRLTLVALADMLAAAVSVAVAAAVANVQQWGTYVAASALLAVTYGLIGVVLAPLFGRIAGVFVAFLVPFLDLGIAQDPMLRATPPAWAHFLPGYGGFRILTNAIVASGAIHVGPLLIALGWLGGAAVAAAVLFRHNMRAARGAPRAIPPRQGPAAG